MFWLISAVLGYTLVANVIERTAGVIISAIFILVILTVSAVSRSMRATELRVETLEFLDEASKARWRSMKEKQVSLIALRRTDAAGRREKASFLRKHYRVEGDFVIDFEGAVAIANTIAWAAVQLTPIALFLKLSQRNPFTQAFRYLLWGEGEIGMLVHEVLLRYWHSTKKDDARPLIYLVSE